MAKTIQLKCDDWKNGKKLHFLIERLILFKWQCFKNNPRGNNLVIRAVFIATLIPAYMLLLMWLLNFFFGITDFYSGAIREKFDFHHYKEYLLPLLAVIIVIYGSIWKDFHSKWEYCSNLFNDILKCNDEEVVSNLCASLSIDLITLDLWAHRSFKETFHEELITAIKEKYQTSALPIIEEAENGLMSETRAMEILTDYQAKLVSIRSYSTSCKCTDK